MSLPSNVSGGSTNTTLSSTTTTTPSASSSSSSSSTANKPSTSESAAATAASLITANRSTMVQTPPPPSATNQFAKRTAAEVVRLHRADVSVGLSSSEVLQRRNVHGPNELTPEEKESLTEKFIDQLKQPLILLLFGSAVVSLILGSYDDAISITLAILIVSTVALVQEYRSEQSLEALNKLVPHNCTVVRNGTQQIVQASDVVPGDVVKLQTGDRIPADVRLVEVVNMEVDESTLTGETKPRKKMVSAIEVMDDANIPLSDRTNIGFMGTLVRQGNGTSIVLAVGEQTEFGHVYRMMKDVEEKKTPLQVKMDELGSQLSMLSLGVIGVIFVLGIIQGRHWLEMFTIAVSLAVAAIPEGLPIVVTVTLALGVMRMASQKAIVKRLPSVESLGSVSVICVDKTGTITRNQMTVTKLFTTSSGRVIDSSEYFKNGRQVQQHQQLASDIDLLLRCATLCNNTALSGVASGFSGAGSYGFGTRANDYVGAPTEVALMVVARSIGVPDARERFDRLQEIPFTSDSKWMAVQCADPNAPYANPLFYVKGAPEVILARSTSYFHSSGTATVLTDDVRQSILLFTRQMAENGLRVLAFSFGKEPSNNLTFVGLMGMVDPPRDNIDQSVAMLKSGGVRVVMMTGDSKETAASIASQIGILDRRKPMDAQVQAGPDFEALDERTQIQTVADVCVFYRATPHHKLAIVRAWQANGAVVGMTGDGVNDAPALKMADIGIAMGMSGTDVSKEAADMILVDDNFNTILSAIEEGKSIYYNIKNFVRFQLSTSISALSLIALSTFIGMPNPLNAMQILWINIIMDGPPAQSLGVEPVDLDVMKRPPRTAEENIIDRRLITRVLTSALCIVTGTMSIYIYGLQDGKVTDRDTTMTFTTFVLFDMFNALACRSESKSIFKIGLASNMMFCYAVGAVLVVQLGVIYVPFLQAILQTVSLSLGDLLLCLSVASTVLIVDEIRKLLQHNRVSSASKTAFAYDGFV